MKWKPSLGERRTQKMCQRYQALSRTSVGAFTYYKALEVLTTVSRQGRQGGWEQLTALKARRRNWVFAPLSSSSHQSLVYHGCLWYPNCRATELHNFCFLKALSQGKAKYGLIFLFKNQRNIFFFSRATWCRVASNVWPTMTGRDMYMMKCQERRN